MPATVLIVDDDATFRSLAAHLVEAAGLTVAGEAGDVSGGRAAAEKLRPDAALVDVRLPDGDGIALASELALLPWSPRIVVTSAQSGRSFPAEALRNGAEAFVIKDELPLAPLSTWLAAG